MDLTIWFLCIKISWVNGSVNHSLNKWVGTGGDETRSSDGMVWAKTTMVIKINVDLIIYLSNIRY